jgi:hypothetical protein
MAANPFGAHQVGAHRADRLAGRCAFGLDVAGRVGRREADANVPTRPR